MEQFGDKAMITLFITFNSFQPLGENSTSFMVDIFKNSVTQSASEILHS
jgi:hypothetical protein